jgi:hypothetical protein
VGQPYAATITFNVTPPISVIGGSLDGVLSVSLATAGGVHGLPPGFGYACHPSNCVFPVNTTGCVRVTGTPATEGEWSVSLATAIDFGIPFPVVFPDGVEPGEYLIVVGPPAPSTNLTVPALKAPAATGPGRSFTITDTTANVGGGAAPPTGTRLWLSADKVLGGDTLLGARAVPVLAAGAESRADTPVTLPAVEPGVYTLIAQADALGVATETSEADNTRAKTLVVGPDLVVKAIATTPAVPGSTAPTTIAVTTRNGGGAPTGTSVTRLYRSADGRVDPADVVLATFVVPGLAPSASSSASVTLTLPPGSYSLIAVADADRSVREARETNNTRKRALTVP